MHAILSVISIELHSGFETFGTAVFIICSSRPCFNLGKLPLYSKLQLAHLHRINELLNPKYKFKYTLKLF